MSMISKHTPSSLISQLAYVFVPGNKAGDRIGLVKYLETGYYPTRSGYDNAGYTDEQARETVNALNENIGVTPAVSQAAMAGSMFGWHVPAAKAARDFFGAPNF